MQTPKNLRVYQEAFNLSVDIYKRFKDEKTSLRLKEQLFGCVSSICANLSEMCAFESKLHQKHKVVICLGEANEAEFWLDLCRGIGVLKDSEHYEFSCRVNAIKRIFSCFSNQ